MKVVLCIYFVDVGRCCSWSRDRKNI